MNKTVPILVVVILAFTGAIFAVHFSKNANKSIDWQYDFNKAAEAAQKANKPLLVDFYTDWCHWCKTLDETTYTNKDVAKLSKGFICVKVDGDRYPKLVNEYQITGYPTIIFLNSNSQEVKRIAGYEEPQQFLQDMQDALDKAR